MQNDFNVAEWGLITPHDQDAAGAQPAVLSEPPAHFYYVGKAFTLDEFASLIPFYDFGPYPPTSVLIHHTAVPTVEQWTQNEAGLSQEQIKLKRLRQLAGIKNYYWKNLRWDRGPHIFSDDRFIYIFTPLNMPGIHAAGGNGTARSFSVGWEVVGDYTSRLWSAATAGIVAGGIARLHQRLGTFDLKDGKGPGYVDAHRHWNKPSCPGNAIQPDYYLPLFRAARAALDRPRAVRAGAYGAIAQQSYTGSAPAAAYFPPGTLIEITPEWQKNGFYHVRSGIGFIPIGHVEPV